jgi:hypothetical protein
MKSLTALFSNRTGTFTRLALAITFFFVAAAANAQSATIKCLGIQEDMVVFNVSYPNPDGTKFVLSVKDQDGTQLYQNSFNDKNFYKQFRLPKTDKDKITFIIRSNRESDWVRSFEINVNSRFIQDIAIKKID